ncbi:MAG TPA: transposase [Methylomirabilota bacterium]|jgi:transposase|nr:transposase [Methylomirabilota bacterium]
MNAEQQDVRRQRGLDIVKRLRIRKTPNGGYIVPSQGGIGTKYAVIMGERPTCTCPDHELHGDRCKHIYAVEYMIQGEFFEDGTAKITETVRVTETVKRTTYPQNWPAYNKAQTTEKDHFQVLLRDLCRGIVEPDAAKTGRPRLPLADVVFAAAFKVYSTVSGRRFMSDLREARKRGHITKVAHYNSIFGYLENAALTPLLRDLITQSSLPLKSVESNFAVDSSGFTTNKFHRWFDHKYGQERQEHDWVKVHIMCGVKTNVVTAIEIQDRNASDARQMPALVDATARNFALAEVSADKGYASAKNTETVMRHGGTPYIAFRTSDTGWTGGAWAKMFRHFTEHRGAFLEHYHKRSNVETTFSMIKRKFGDAVRSKTDVAMMNEALCKVLCHNLVVLIHESHELGIEPAFWADSSPARELVG